MDTEAGLAISAGFLIDLGQKVDEMHKRITKQVINVWDAPFVIGLSAVAGAVNFDGGTQLSPQAGQTWSIRRLTLSGFTLTSGTLQVLLDGQEPIVSVTAGATAVSAPSINLFGRGDVLLTNTSKLTVTGTGVTGSPALSGRADCFESWYLSEYLS